MTLDDEIVCEDRVLTVDTTTKISAAELMSAVFDNLFRDSSSWVFKIRWDWHRPLDRRVAICYENPTGDAEACSWDGWRYSHVGPEDLLRGLEAAIAAKQMHCGERITADLDTWDTCCADEVLQYTLFGESIYG